jgi:hypothetical protein
MAHRLDWIDHGPPAQKKFLDGASAQAELLIEYADIHHNAAAFGRLFCVRATSCRC